MMFRRPRFYDSPKNDWPSSHVTDRHRDGYAFDSRCAACQSVRLPAADRYIACPECRGGITSHEQGCEANLQIDRFYRAVYGPITDPDGEPVR